MKRILAFTVCIATLFAEGVTISDVIVRQQWPWSTDIKVEYKLSGVTEPVNVTVTAYNGSQVLDSSNYLNAIRGDLYGISTGGAKSFTIDPEMAFGAEAESLSDFKVRLMVSESPDNMSEVLYKIFDLTTGECEDVTRAQLLNGEKGSVETDFGKIGEGYNTSLEDVVIWTGVTNDAAYKTTHLVMRKIPATGKVWQIGSPSGEPGRAIQDNEDLRYVKLTQDFYIGVFPVTQAQFMKVYKGNEVNTPSNPSTFTDAPDSEYRPVNNVSYSNLRGNLSYTGPSGEKINWPTNGYLHEVVTEYTRPSFMRDIRRLCKNVEFDLPFDPQWEFACRAGVYGKGLNDGLGLRSGAAESDRLDALGWYSGNSDGSTHVVGLKRPNAFGLYDMHGNVSELLANWVGNVSNASSGTGTSAEDPLVDPVGPVGTGGARVSRGGNFSYIPGYCRSASRALCAQYYEASEYQGFRLVCPVGTTWE